MLSCGFLSCLPRSVCRAGDHTSYGHCQFCCKGKRCIRLPRKFTIAVCSDRATFHDLQKTKMFRHAKHFYGAERKQLVTRSKEGNKAARPWRRSYQSVRCLCADILPRFCFPCPHLHPDFCHPTDPGSC